MISIVIPAYNETKYLGRTLSGLKQMELDTEIIVVDDCSEDETGEIAKHSGADQVIRMEKRSGKGDALKRGLLNAQGDILMFLDADLGECAGQAHKLLEPILQNQADMTIASFPVTHIRKGGFGFVVRLARWGIRKTTGLEMNSPISGQRAIRRIVIDKIGGIERGFGVEVGLTIDAYRKGFRIMEVPTTMTHRVTGRNMRDVFHRLRQFLDVARVLSKRWRLRANA